MALNHNHQAYDNYVLANEIEDQINSRLSLLRFATIDNSLVGVPGEVRKIRRYSASDGAQQLEMGQGNTKNIEVSYAEEEYRVMLTQARFAYYDEEPAKDPYILETGLQHLTDDMYNTMQKRIFDEFCKASRSCSTTNFDYNAFVDAISLLNLPETNADGQGASLFAFVNPAQMAEIRKQLKDELKYVEAFARTGYVGTIAGVDLYTKKDAPSTYIVLATKKAVTYFNKKGTEVEQERVDGNRRLNTIYARKVGLAALTNDTQIIRIIKGSGNTGAGITTESLADGKVGTVYNASIALTGTGTKKVSIERGLLPDGITMTDAGVLSGSPTTIGTYSFTIQASNDYGVASKQLQIKITQA